MNVPTIALVGCDSLRYERIRASLARSPFCLQRMERLPGGRDADVAIVPVDRLERGRADGPPVIAWGPPGMMRAAFLAGCADYLREPWTTDELVLRAEGVLARQAPRYQFAWGRVRWDGDRLLVPRGAVPFTRRQAVVLRALLRCRGQPVAREALAVLLGRGAERGARRGSGRPSRRVDVHVSEIRKRVRAVEPDAGSFITCVRGQGYMVP